MKQTVKIITGTTFYESPELVEFLKWLISLEFSVETEWNKGTMIIAEREIFIPVDYEIKTENKQGE